eukprot:271392_1
MADLEVLEVETVLGHATFEDERGESIMQWLIKWKGHDETQSTWERLQNVQHSSIWKQYQMNRSNKAKRKKKSSPHTSRKRKTITLDDHRLTSPPRPTKRRKIITEVIDLISDSESSDDHKMNDKTLTLLDSDTESDNASDDIEIPVIPSPPPQFVFKKAMSVEQTKEQDDLMIETPFMRLQYPRFRVFGTEAIISMSSKELIEVREDKTANNNDAKCWLDPELG